MQPTGHRDASFSPYHDENRVLDFLDDDAQRLTVKAALVFLVHLGLALSLSGSFIVPDLKPPPDPEAVIVEIVSFDPEPEPEPEPEPIIVEPKPAPQPPAPVPEPRPAPPPAPKPEPIPEPMPEPAPPPEPEPVPQPIPEPEPIPEPIPEPEPVITPPPPEILVQPETIEPDPIAEPIPEPIIEIFDPLPEPVLEPLPEPLPEPILEPELEPVFEFLEPEPLPEIILEPEPLPEPVLEPEPAPVLDPIFENLEPEPEPVLDPIFIEPDLTPTPGIIAADPLPEIIEPEPLPPEIILEPETPPAAEVIFEPEPVAPVDLEPLPEPEIELIAPTILASPDAPESAEEQRRAVPQEQSDPFLDLLKKDRNSSLQDPISQPRSGGGNQGPISQSGTAAVPPGGGTQIGRTAPGSTGWTLAPQRAGPGEAYEGINLDIRCREEGRTHEDCPEYIKKFRGRDRSGRESFDGFAGTGTDRGDRISNSRAIPTRSQLGLNIGDPSINSGASTTDIFELPEVNFDREFPANAINTDPPAPGLIERLTPSHGSVPSTDWTLKPPPETPSNNQEGDGVDWVLKNPDE